MEVDIFLELTFQEACNSQAKRDEPIMEPASLARYERLADRRDWRER